MRPLPASRAENGNDNLGEPSKRRCEVHGPCSLTARPPSYGRIRSGPTTPARDNEDYLGTADTTHSLDQALATNH